MNRSGFLDYRELRPALKLYGMDVTTPQAKAILAAYDDTPDGKLDLKEFGELVKDIASGKTSIDGKGKVNREGMSEGMERAIGRRCVSVAESRADSQAATE